MHHVQLTSIKMQQRNLQIVKVKWEEKGKNMQSLAWSLEHMHAAWAYEGHLTDFFMAQLHVGSSLVPI